ncbi:effector-associated constant component EACC1 [Prauserella cavernicola]|uniref:Uncharacterized protein n=1 Tax=Prauserella cavernicola TaxID=2800127 RepID=A0A934QYH8_9PSEU|nr:hypothetical protein [Prauserella cavernicola]MBK1788477.1 hypothetical protein [Prauserella cavernicola]
MVEAGVVAATTGGSEHDLRSLAFWLRSEDEFRGRVELEEAPAHRGEPSSELDAVVTVLPPAAASSFASSVLAWLTHHHGVHTLSLTVRSAAGAQASLSCHATDDPRQLAGTIRRLLGDGS